MVPSPVWLQAPDNDLDVETDGQENHHRGMRKMKNLFMARGHDEGGRGQEPPWTAHVQLMKQSRGATPVLLVKQGSRPLVGDET